MGSHTLLQGILLTQGSNPSPALQADSLLSEPPGKPLATSKGMFSLIKEFDSQGQDHLGNLSFTKGKLTKKNSCSAGLLNAILMVGVFLRNFLHLRDDYKYTVFNRDCYDFLKKKKSTNYPLSSFVAQRKKKLYNSRHFVQERRGNEYHMACLL